MADICDTLRDSKHSFLQVDPSFVPQIACVFIGESQLYTQGKRVTSQNRQHLRYEGIVVLNSKHEICSLVADKRKRRRLLKLMGVKIEEGFDLYTTSSSSPLYDEFDAVRVSGHDKENVRRTVTLLSLEYFAQSKKSLNILSGMDRRVWASHSQPIRLCQVTTLDDATILHDQWLYTSKTVARFGIVTDLLLSSACVYGESHHGRDIKRTLVEHYVSVTGASPSVSIFARSSEFDPSYAQWFARELAGLSPMGLNTTFNPAEEPDHAILFGRAAQISVHVGLNDFRIRTSELPLEAVDLFNKGDFLRQEGHKPQFSNNSSSYLARTKPPGAIFDIFVKETPFAHQELIGAQLGSQYFPRISVPYETRQGELLYKFFLGRTTADVRLSYIRGGRKDMVLFERLLHAELVKTGDTLRAYQSSLSAKNYPWPRRYGIQRFFYDRLLNDRRIQAHYGKGITLGGETIPLERLLSLRWVINNKPYPCLRQAYKESCDIICPTSKQILFCPSAFGLGDAHGGNVMIDESTNDILFIDYEVAGLHPIMLDLAKPLYNDLAYEILYRRLISDGINLGLKYNIDLENNTIELTFKPQIDPLTQALFDIKVRYLLEPLCDGVRLLQDYVPLLSTSLFLCATLGISLASNEEAFLANFATGLILRDAQTWRGLRSRLEELGFKHRAAPAL